MSAITAIRGAKARSSSAKGSALDRLTVQFARLHATHISPIVGCYLCLHNEPRVTSRELLTAA